MKDRLKTSDHQVWYYGFLVPDTYKVMYKDGNRMGTRSKIAYAKAFEAEIYRRSKAIENGTAEYLPDDYIRNLLDCRKTEKNALIAKQIEALLGKQTKLAKYDKKLPKRHLASLNNLLKE